MNHLEQCGLTADRLIEIGTAIKNRAVPVEQNIQIWYVPRTTYYNFISRSYCPETIIEQPIELVFRRDPKIWDSWILVEIKG